MYLCVEYCTVQYPHIRAGKKLPPSHPLALQARSVTTVLLFVARLRAATVL